MSSWLPEPPVSFSLLPRRMGRGRGKGSAWTPGFSGYRASWYTSVSGCVVRASMCAHFVHVWAGEGSDSPLEWGTGAAALRMRGECVCLHVSVCVRGQTRLHLLARSRLLSLSPSPLPLSPALTHTHTQFSISPPFPHSLPLLPAPLSPLPSQSLPHQPCLCLFVWLGAISASLGVPGRTSPLFVSPRSFPSLLGRALQGSQTPLCHLLPGRGEWGKEDPSPVPMMPSAVSALAP